MTARTTPFRGAWDFIRLILRSFADFLRDEGPMLAGAISCFFLLAFVPFILLMVSVLGYLLGGYSHLHDVVLKLLTGFFPSVTRQITQEMGTVIGNRQIGIVSLLLYCALSLELFFALETGVQAMFEVKIKRSFLKSLAISLITATLLISFTLASFATTWFIHVIEALSRFFPTLRVGAVAGVFTSLIVPVCVVFVVLTTLYAVLPSRRVLRHALAGGLFATILLEAAKFLFTYFIAWRVLRLGAVYGSLTAIVVFLLWVFYASSIFLMGAKLVHNLGAAKR